MASINVGRGISTLTSPAYFRTVGLVLAGMLFSTVATGWLNDNFVDLGIPYEEAVYGFMAVFLIRLLLSGRTSMLIAAGAGSGAVVTAAREAGLL